MIVVSYDIQNDKLRTKFAKALRKNGAIRLQFSVYEINNTNRVIENLRATIRDQFSKSFSADDSVVIMEVDKNTMEKFGNAIHRDQDAVFL